MSAPTTRDVLTHPVKGPGLIYRGHILELDAFRAFGIVVVIAAHFWPQNRSYKLWEVLQMGWALMDTFFVVSGFLIVGILMDSRERPDYYRTYYIRRTLRVFPIYYLMLAALFCAMALGSSGAYTQTLATWGSLAWFVVYLGNIPSAATGRWPAAALDNSFTPMWSLQVEEQFYLLVPFLIRRLSVKAMTRLLWVLVFVSPAIRIACYFASPSNTLIQYVLLPCHMDGLALGALLAIRFRSGPWEVSKTRLSALTLACIAFTFVFGVAAGFTHEQPLIRTVGFSLSSFTSALVVLWLILYRGSRITAVLRTGPVQHMGKISYGLYLVHLPVGFALTAIWTSLFGAHLHGLTKLVLVFIVSVGLSSLSWRYFEAPLLGLKDRLSASKVRTRNRDRGNVPAPLVASPLEPAAIASDRESVPGM